MKKRRNDLLIAAKPLFILLNSDAIFSFYAVFRKLGEGWNKPHPNDLIVDEYGRFLWPIMAVQGHLQRITKIETNTPEHLCEDLFYICHDVQSIAERFFKELSDKRATATGWSADQHDIYTKLRDTWSELVNSYNAYCDKQGNQLRLLWRPSEIGSIGVSDGA